MALIKGYLNQDGLEAAPTGFFVDDDYRRIDFGKNSIRVQELNVSDPFTFDLRVPGLESQAGANGQTQITNGTIRSVFISSGDSKIVSLRGIEIDAAEFYQESQTEGSSGELSLIKNAFAGNDTFLLSDSDDIARSYDGDDRIFGRAGDDSLDGGSGKDVINGGDGRDVITGGFDADRLTGGAGADTFIYQDILDSGNNNQERDVITDFNGAEGDVIDLSAINFDTNGMTFIGSNKFTGSAGEVRFADGVLQVSDGSSLNAVMEIELLKVSTFNESYLIL